MSWSSNILPASYNIQILQLLEAMKLEKYHDTFIQQEIDGQLLADSCDELVLEHDLKVSSKLHRARFLRVIHGQRSAVTILQEKVLLVGA